MPRIKHVVEREYKPSFRSEKVTGMFDVAVTDKLRREWDVTLPIEEKPWNVGLIVGASGSGKTQLANRIFAGHVHRDFLWKRDCFLDDIAEDIDCQLIFETLSKVGFSSPPQWLLPYRDLSNGQKFRAELARCLCEYQNLFVFDEFTSLVDRQVARIGAYAFGREIRKRERQFVAVTCHYDVEEWLEPDWVFDVSSNTFRWGSLRRPPINLKIVRVNHQAWELFKEHHYLSADINKAAICFVGLLDDRPVVFDSWLPFFGRLTDGSPKAMRGHRTVCLPDFQGLGLGNALFTEIARMWAGLGKRVFSGTAHPAEISKRMRSNEWVLTGQGRNPAEQNARGVKHASNRLICRFEFTGKPMRFSEALQLHGG